jgi:hypothetical protein
VARKVEAGQKTDPADKYPEQPSSKEQQRRANNYIYPLHTKT